MARRLAVLALAAIGFVAAAACGKSPDLKNHLKIENAITGYFDDGPTANHENRLLPSITFQLKNETDESLSYIDLAVDFWQNGDDGPKDSKIVAGVSGKALEPGQTSESLTIHSSIGYTLPGPRADIFTNSLFKGFVAKIYAKSHGRTSPLGELKVEPRLLPPAGRDGNRP
jgi:hypothetical protein